MYLFLTFSGVFTDVSVDVFFKVVVHFFVSFYDIFSWGRVKDNFNKIVSFIDRYIIIIKFL